MPIYEYRCGKCGTQFEGLVARADAPAPPCPECKAPKAEKQLSVIGGVHMGSTRSSCPTGPTCATAAGGGCRSCPMSAA
jgi:putative FmdB family regulatory protein